MSFALKILYSLFFDLSPLCSGPVGIILFPAYSFVSPHPHIIVFTSFQFFQCIRSCLVGTNCDDLWFFVMSICTILDLISTGLFFNRLPSDIQSSGTCCQFCNTGFCRLNLKQNAVTEYSCCMRGRLSIDIEQQISQIVLASWFDSGADLLPVGQTHTFGVQTVPFVAAISLHLIDGILAASVQCCCYDLSAENICMKFLFQLEGWLYNSHPPRIGSPATAGIWYFCGDCCTEHSNPLSLSPL